MVISGSARRRQLRPRFSARQLRARFLPGREVVIDEGGELGRLMSEVLVVVAQSLAVLGRHRLLEDLSVDLLIKAVIRTCISVIGNAAFTVAELLGHRQKARAVSQRAEAGESLPTLMRGKPPALALVVRQSEPKLRIDTAAASSAPCPRPAAFQGIRSATRSHRSVRGGATTTRGDSYEHGARQTVLRGRR